MDYIIAREERIKNEIKGLYKHFNPANVKILNKFEKEYMCNCSYQTVLTYFGEIKRFLDYIGKKYDLKNIKSVDIKKFLGYLKRNNKSGKLTYSALLSFARFLEEKGRKEIPKLFRMIELPKTARKFVEPLDFQNDILPMIKKTFNARDKAIIYCLFESMMRRSEFLALRIKDVDLSKVPSPVNIRISKTENGKNRYIFFYDSIPVLKSWLNIHPDKENPDAPLFCTTTGKILGENGLRGVILGAAKRAGIKNVYAHRFRHSRAYELGKNYNFSNQELMKIGGWQNSTMLDNYINPKQKDIRDKILNGHGIKTTTQEEKNKKLKDRKLKICNCGRENNPKDIFCQDCGLILNPKAYKEKIFEKDNQIEELKQGFKKEINNMFKEFKKDFILINKDLSVSEQRESLGQQQYDS